MQKLRGVLVVAALLSCPRAARAEELDRAVARFLVETDPPRAIISVDGRTVGSSPAEVELLPGTHRLVVEAPGHVGGSQTLTAVAGRREKTHIRLVPAERRSPLRVAGWTAAGVGLAAIGVGIALFAIDDTSVSCEGESRREECPQRWDTRTGAWVLSGVGLASVLTGAYFLYRGYRGETPRPEPSRMAITGTGIRLSFDL